MGHGGGLSLYVAADSCGGGLAFVRPPGPSPAVSPASWVAEWCPGHCQVVGCLVWCRVSESRGGLCGAWGQAAAGRPTTSFQVAQREVISRQYWTAVSRWRWGRKCGDIPLNADRNRGAPPGEVNFFIACSRCRVGWWEFSALLLR